MGAETLWSSVFFEMSPGVYAVEAEWRYDVDTQSGDLEAARSQENRMMAGDATAVAVLDGGILFHSVEWVEEESVEVLDDDEVLEDGVYVIGRQCMRLVADSIGVAPPESEVNDPNLETLRDLAGRRWVLTGDPARQAKAVLERAITLAWDGLRADLGPWVSPGP